MIFKNLSKLRCFHSFKKHPTNIPNTLPSSSPPFLPTNFFPLLPQTTRNLLAGVSHPFCNPHQQFKRFLHRYHPSQRPYYSRTSSGEGLLSPSIFSKTAIFTGFVVASSFTVAIIMEHRRLSSTRMFPAIMDDIWPFNMSKGNLTYKNREMNLYEMVRNEWRELSDCDKLISYIIGANVAVFLLWHLSALVSFRRPFSGLVFRLQNSMEKYFVMRATDASLAPLILSAFSHKEAWHLAVNMFVLVDFGRFTYDLLGREQFLSFYFSAAVFSAFISKLVKSLFMERGGSLGASGAIMALVSMMVQIQPDASFRFVFIPFFSFPAKYLFASLLSFDLAGLIFRWRFFDHAAHLAGAFFGWVFVTNGGQFIKDQKTTVVRQYEDLKSRWDKYTGKR